MTYLPEWKIYLWKKLLLNYAGEFDRVLTPRDFRFFTENEQRDQTRHKIQTSINILNRAVAKKSLIDIHGRYTDEERSFYHFSERDFIDAVLELTRKPACIELTNIRIDRNFLRTCHGSGPYRGLGDFYTKIDEEKEITVTELQQLTFTDLEIIEYLSFEIKINKNNLQKKLDGYLKEFIEARLLPTYGLCYIDPRKQIYDFLCAISHLANKYGLELMLTADDLAKAGGWYSKEENHYRFYETVFALEYGKYLTIKDIYLEEIAASLNHEAINKFINDNTPTNQLPVKQLYITKEGDDFFYKGKLLKLSRKADYFKVFSALYALLGQGGEIDYSTLGREVQSRIPKTKEYSRDKMQKFIQSNLKDRNHGFVHYAEIPETEDNGKPLFSVIRGSGIEFNNSPS